MLPNYSTIVSHEEASFAPSDMLAASDRRHVTPTYTQLSSPFVLHMKCWRVWWYATMLTWKRNFHRRRKRGWGKRNAGEAGWLSSVINLVNTSMRYPFHAHSIFLLLRLCLARVSTHPHIPTHTPICADARTLPIALL
jgi:hypothetical protein